MTLKDVAALAGVSVSTVSRVINNNVPVEPETKRKVEAAIQKLGYRPNLLAKGLRAGSGAMIGLIVPMTAHPTFSLFSQYICDYCSKKGYNLVIGSHHNNPDIEEFLIDSFSRRNIDGLIISLVSDESRALSMIHNHPIPTVIIDRVVNKERHKSVIVDNYLAGKLMAEHFVSLGHKKVGCITGPMSINLARERLQGFRDALSEHGITLNERFVIEEAFEFEAGIAAAKKMLRNKNDLPTAIWAHSDDIAAGVLKYANLIGLEVPHDLSLAGMDDNQLAKVLAPSLTTIAQPIRQMSEIAVDIIINKSANDSYTVFEPTLCIRESTAKLS